MKEKKTNRSHIRIGTVALMIWFAIFTRRRLGSNVEMPRLF
jgi:hypothetical protein